MHDASVRHKSYTFFYFYNLARKDLIYILYGKRKELAITSDILSFVFCNSSYTFYKS